jgi:hypothetical protein
VIEDRSPDYPVSSHFVESLHVDAKRGVMEWLESGASEGTADIYASEPLPK